MSSEKHGVDVIINKIEDNPSCTHGPTILFERVQEGGESRRFYACSACRDRRHCSFFHWAHHKINKTKTELWTRLFKESQPATSHEEEYQRLQGIRTIAASKRSYCLSCSTLIRNNEKCGHSSCSLITPVTDSHLCNPSTLLPPKEASKYEAQYLFAKRSVDTILSLLTGLDVSLVLCVGAPRVHEAITSTSEPAFASLLLDIDNRYRSFFSPKHFLHYNMFNHHFFGGDKPKRTYRDFIGSEGNLAIVTDPPFGGRMELLAHNLMRIQDDWRTARALDSERILPILFIFPYFMENQVLSCLPSFIMLDYQVDYDNHPLYSSGPKGMKNGSAVRIFTNQKGWQCALPESEGYHFCQLCQRWVASSNIHCIKCGGCMSKDGRTYKHCDECGKCVKPSWQHCSTCSHCQPHDHQCRPNHHPPTPTCHKCGALGHKRAHCLKRSPPQPPIPCTAYDSISSTKLSGVRNTTAAGEETERKQKKKKKRKKNDYPQTLEAERQRNLSLLEELG